MLLNDVANLKKKKRTMGDTNHTDNGSQCLDNNKATKSLFEIRVGVENLGVAFIIIYLFCFVFVIFLSSLLRLLSLVGMSCICMSYKYPSCPVTSLDIFFSFLMFFF